MRGTDSGIHFDKVDITTHFIGPAQISTAYRSPMSHLFDKPTLSSDKAGLSNLILWLSEINLLYRPMTWFIFGQVSITEEIFILEIQFRHFWKA